MGRRKKNNPQGEAIAKMIVEQYQPNSAEEVQEAINFVTTLPAEKLQNFFGVFLQFHFGVDSGWPRPRPVRAGGGMSGIFTTTLRLNLENELRR